MSKARMVETFTKLVQIDSVSRNEGAVHEHLHNILSSIGMEVAEDSSKETTGLGGNNIIATYYGKTNQQPLFFSCHTDTVTPGVGIEVVEKDGILYSKGETILAADDKAGIAILIEAMQRIQEENIETGNIEFVLSPGEEIGLIGASALDMHLIEAEYGYVLDSAFEVGRVTIASPTLYMYDVTLTGKSAHAGLEPEKGISCVAILAEALKEIPIGRLDEKTTTNIGAIQGGEATNIVMDKLLVKGEVRAIDPARADQLIAQMQQAFEEAATKFGGKVAINVKKMATGFHIKDEEPVMQLLLQAAEKLGYEVIREISGGGSDANIFNLGGKTCVNLSIGYDKIHTTDELVVIDEMDKAVNLVIELLKQAPEKVPVNHE
ncbi:MAG: M20/M25/M40 family metallo-hydrolase [Enterococcus sp.]|nr:M20/M25/M40 family metallo-hydrolase [Enterococcus sp.]